MAVDVEIQTERVQITIDHAVLEEAISAHRKLRGMLAGDLDLMRDRLRLFVSEFLDDKQYSERVIGDLWVFWQEQFGVVNGVRPHALQFNVSLGQVVYQTHRIGRLTPVLAIPGDDVYDPGDVSHEYPAG